VKIRKSNQEIRNVPQGREDKSLSCLNFWRQINKHYTRRQKS